MNNTGRLAAIFLTGLGIGAGLALLFAPQSGEETQQWLTETAEEAEKKVKRLQRKGRQSIERFQDAVAEGEDKVTKVLKSGKDILESVAAKLD